MTRRWLSSAALALSVAALPGCAWFQSHGGPGAVDCASEKLAAQSVLLVPAVLAILGGGSWEAELQKLGTKVGSDVLACALLHVHLHVPAAREKTGKAARALTYRGLP